MILLALAALAAQSVSVDTDFFEKRVRPVLVRRCQGCHGASRQFGGLRLDSRAALEQRGTASILSAIRGTGKAKMPADGPLAPPELADLELWLSAGAPWPVENASKPREESKTHWAFEPVKRVEPPFFPNTAHPVDRFIRLRLGSEGLFPAPPADRRTLIRRLSFVLTGLPPTPSDTDQFLRDNSPNAYENLVDRLLKSPHYGEQWARHWMDVVRFGETLGYEWNYEVLGAWRYRDYLIRAFNEDIPYQQLIREQIAGDLLPRPRVNSKLGINESLIGTAFFRLGEAGHDDCIEFREICLDQIDNQIDTLGKAFQGLTIACARCHNHKVDPIPTADYYGVQGVLLSSRPVTHTLDTGEVFAGPLERLKRLKQRIRRELSAVWLREAENMRITPDAKAGFDHPARALANWDVTGFRKEAAARVQDNGEKFVRFDEWYAKGLGLREGRSKPGEFFVSSSPDGIITGIYPSGYYSNALSDKLNGSLRSGILPRVKKFVSLELMGGKLGAVRTVIDNGQIGEVFQTLNKPELGWVKLPTQEKAKNLPVYLELLTKHDNPRYPDRPGRLRKDELPWLGQPRSFIGLSRAYLHDVDAAPKGDLGWLERLYRDEKPPDVSARLRQIGSEAIIAWRDGTATDDDVRWLQWMLEEGVLSNCHDTAPKLTGLVADYWKAEAELRGPQTVSGLGEDGPGFDVPILPYGDWKNPGKVVPRGFLHLVSQGKTSSMGSGRLDLAEWIATEKNPLTARVMVNRIWRHAFGEGLVNTPDNFGRLAEAPSHPELLDWLASEFVRDGWSIKKMVRLLVTSQTFRQSSVPSWRAPEVDPRNRLLQHANTRRLEAESIRDAMLRVSGRLDETMYGESIHPHREKPQDYRRLFSGPLDGAGRRSVYLKVTRMQGARFLEAFDFPPPLVARGARDVTNVPAQALALLNDPFVVDQARVWAEQLIQRQRDTIDSRLEVMFETALSRGPTGAERERFRQFVFQIVDLQGIPKEAMMSACEVWREVAHAVFNLKEFIYVP